MTTKTLEKSIDELMWQCYQAAIKIAYLDDNCSKTRPQPSNVSNDLFDEILNWAKWHYQKSFFDRMTGRCSFKELLEFSMEDETKYMREFLVRLKALKIGEQ